ncbi:DMT family transporter [Cellulomonas sp. NPDC089187]|uniref:DMT family transporter n=1 Tax=Cellulomonas sp. NPDC089187 TaxID=3154970 RepID=UPI0034453B35
MEAKGRWLAITAVAPIAWGANYVVTRQMLPADALLWGSALRALPAGLVLLPLARALPHGRQWWQSVVLALLNVAGFFALVYASAQLLPSNIASSIMALSPLALTFLAWPLTSERPTFRAVAGGVIGAGALVLVLGGTSGAIDPVGVVAAVAALLSSSTGALLGKRWSAGTPVLASTAWQMTLGGLVLAAVAAIGGPPPEIDLRAGIGFAFTSLIATALAFLCWFGGLKHLPAAQVGALGMLNPLTGILLGTVVVGESLTVVQIVGIVVVLAAVAWSTIRPRRRVPAAVPEAVVSEVPIPPAPVPR